MSALYVLPNEDSIDSVSSSVLSSSASTSTTASARTRKESRNYYLSSIHDSYEEAVKVVEQEMLWRKSNKTKSTQYYKCNKVKCRDKNQCASALYIYKDPESQKASIFAIICPHTHALINAFFYFCFLRREKLRRPALARRALLRQPLASIKEADDDEIDETDAIDDYVEYNPDDYNDEHHDHSTINAELNDHPLDCSVDLNNDMFGLLSTTDASTPNASNLDSMYTVSHLTTITESSPSSSYLNVMPSTSASTIDVCSKSQLISQY